MQEPPEEHRDNQLAPRLRDGPPAVTEPGPGPGLGPGYTHGYGYGYGGYEHAEEAGEAGLLEYWNILKRRRGTLLVAVVLGGLAAVLITLPQTKIYQARTTIEVQNLNPDFMDMKEVSQLDSASGSSEKTDLQTQVEILKSGTLTTRTLRKLGWIEPPKASADTSTDRISAWRRALRLSGDGPTRSPDLLALDYAAENLTVRSQGQTRIVEILVDSPNPALAARFANTLTAEFTVMNLEDRWESTQRTSEWLRKQLEEMRIKLEKSQEALQAYARQSGLLYTGEDRNVSEEKLLQIQADLSAAESERVRKQSRYELATTAPPEVLPDVLTDETLRDYQQRLTELRREEAELATTFTPAHPKVRRVTAQVEAIEKAFQNTREAILGRIRGEYEEAVRREELLRDEYVRQAQRVTSQSEKAVQYDILKREATSSRQLYDTMLERVEEASVAGALSASNVRIVDAAEPPDFPYKPRTSMNALLGLMLGGFLGVVFVIVRERADRSLQDPGDVTLFLELPELGVIPAAKMDGEGWLPHYRRYRRLADGRKELASESRGGSSEGQLELVTWKNRPSVLAESFRTTLTSILFSMQNGGCPRVLVFTSSQPSEGKTTVASNVAIALAELSRRVLLIDGDLRKPRIHDIFEIERAGGLAEYLADNRPVKDCLNGSVRQTMVPGLFVLPSGADSAEFTNMLYSTRMAELIEHFEARYDMVIIDSPPLLTMPDARILGRMADAVVLVIRAGSTTRDTALAARQRLIQDGTRVLGTVLNRWDPKKSAGGPGYRNYYDKYHRGVYYAGREG